MKKLNNKHLINRKSREDWGILIDQDCFIDRSPGATTVTSSFSEFQVTEDACADGRGYMKLVSSKNIALHIPSVYYNLWDRSVSNLELLYGRSGHRPGQK